MSRVITAVVSFALMLGCQGQVSDPTGAAERDPADPIPEPPQSCEGVCVGESGLSRLTQEQYLAAIEYAFGVDVTGIEGLPVDGRAGAFSTNESAEITLDAVGQYDRVAETLAARLAPSIELACDPASNAEACGVELHRRFSAKLFRRPIESEEALPYGELFSLTFDQTGEADAIQLTLTTLLASPHFLYRPEEADGSGPSPLSGVAIANRLAAFLWSGVPDESLIRAAEVGELDTADGVQSVAQDMFDDPRADASIARFHRQWLQLEQLEAPLAASMLAETDGFSVALLRSDEPTVQALLTSSFSPLDSAMAEFYGTEPGPWQERSERTGILNHASFLTEHGRDGFTRPIFRGLFVRTELLCQPMALPEALLEDVEIVLEQDFGELSAREELAVKTSGENCVACHARINDLGFAFENFDPEGRFRELDEVGNPIDSSGVLEGGGDASGPFSSGSALLANLSVSEEVESCVARQWFRHALGRVDSRQDRATVEGAAEVLAETGGDLRELMMYLVSTDAFRYRSAPAR